VTVSGYVFSFLGGLHFSQTFPSLAAATQQGWAHFLPDEAAVSQQDVLHLVQPFPSFAASTQHGWLHFLPAATAWSQQVVLHFSQTLPSFAAATQQGCVHFLPAAAALVQQEMAKALLANSKPRAQPRKTTAVSNFIAFT
jgi:hypothetical protein